ncbi:prepilin peptidase [Polynucleobacter sp. AP-Reno-20A-A9]|uniref:A24 family peptidase n=1 Tax=Polynucleobacter sp. AP-Reno-20A-A9 TaxID=2576925 RepID=UPI001C0E86F1|nr:prepilin peptidase [Polynucleobacter sp. AP-Reno-20A-A9]MBU3628863.1 prepilin peptidase [Polynucleobacter sp. AP-Reno-20A-A9]
MSVTFPFLAVISLATILDLVTRRISNYLILIGLAAAFILAYVNGGLGALANSVLGATLGLLVFIYPYVKSLMGAGDVKLMAVVGAFLGPYAVLLTALYASMIGGLIVLAYLLYRGLLAESLSRAFRLRFSSERIPYAFAISLGACVALLNPTLF